MYQVNLGNKILYYPANDEFAIYDTELTEDIGIAGEFTFKVPPTNLLYSELSTGKLITVLKDKKEFWRGEIRDITIDFAKIATVYVVEDVAWLGDEFIPPAKIITQTYKQRLDAVIATYNSTRPSDRQFISGSVYNGADICNWQTEYEWSILDSIRKCICRDDYYVKVRRVYESGVIRRYIDIVRLQEYGKSTTQPIEYGYNLLDYVKESDYGNLTNVLTPYGEELEDSEVYTDYSARLQGTTISNNASINTYGRHAKAVVFDGVTNASTLNNLAASYLSRYSQPQLTMEVKAVDLSMIENVQDISIGDKVRIIAKPFAVDQELFLTEIVRDLQNVDKNTLTLSGHVTRKTLTSQMLQATDAIEELPSEWDILKAAKKNALAMLLDETQGGHVVYEYDSTNSYIVAINICDMPTLAASTKRWKWGQNGLGYLERTSTSAPWPTGANIKAAMTADGQIVADRITSGALNAQIITAGILKDANNQFSLNMTTGALTMNSGTFKGALSGATGTFAGSLNAATGTFKGSLSAATGSFSGKITANDGSIGGMTISGSSIGSKNNYLDNVYMSNTLFCKYNKIGSSWGGIEYGTTGGHLNWEPCLVLWTPSSSDGFICMQGSPNEGNTGSYTGMYPGTFEIVEGGHSVALFNRTFYERVVNSDRRLKEDIESIKPTKAKTFIMNLDPVSFRFNEDSALDSSKVHFGFIAQDVKEDAVKVFDVEDGIVGDEDNRGYYSLNYNEIIAPLVSLVQNQQNEIEKMKKEINKLKGDK